MKKKRKIVLVIILVIALLLVGYFLFFRKSIVGSWTKKDEHFTYTFKSDGTGYYVVNESQMNFKYKTKGNNLTITYPGNDTPSKAKYSINGKKLIIKYGKTKKTYIKK